MNRIDRCGSPLPITGLEMLGSPLLSGGGIRVGEDWFLEGWLLSHRTFETGLGFDARSIVLGRLRNKVLGRGTHGLIIANI